MIVIGLAAAGTVIGFVWQKRRSRSTGQEERPESPEGRPLHIVVSGGRRAFVTSLVLLRTATLHSFKRTAAHYAPVPLTFSAAILSNLPAIFGTAFSINYVVINGISLASIVWRARKGGVDSAAPEPLDEERTKSAAVTHAVCCGTGIVGFVMFQRQWENSPLRGTLSVFGKGAKLDRCASAERYLAEKLALLAYAGFRRVASLRQLMSAGGILGSGIGDGGGGASTSSGAPAATASAAPLSSYARDVIGQSAVLAEVEGVFSEYSARYIQTHEDMKVLSDKLKYPSAVRHIEPGLSKASDALLAPLRAKNAARDIRDKLEELHRELGDQFQPRVVLALMNLSSGLFLGVELAQLPLLRDL